MYIESLRGTINNRAGRRRGRVAGSVGELVTSPTSCK